MRNMFNTKAVAIAHSHAGEVMQGAIRDGGHTHRLLFSLPAPTLATKAELIATPGQPLTVSPSWARKALSAAQTLLRRFDLPEPEAVICLTTNIPTAKGCGSSTTDILATIRMLLAYFELSMSEEETARFIVEIEEASDGSMLSRPALFRHREGVVEEYLPGTFPNVHVIVIDTQPRHTVNTVSMRRAYYDDRQLNEFQELIGRLRHAFRDQNSSEFGFVATASARISQMFLPKPHLETLIEMVEREEGYGLSVSHSGTVVSALLPSCIAVDRRNRIGSQCADLGMRVITEYTLGSAMAQAQAA